jgi:DHA2 family multidrug resistance protein
MVQGLSRMFGGGADGNHLAQGQIYNQLNQQAAALGSVDVYRMLCWMSVLMVFCAFMLSKNRPGQGAPEGAVH